MSEREQMEKVNFVNAGTPEDFFAYVEKVKALHKANKCFCQQGGTDDEKEWIERLDNPQLSMSEQFNLGMEADFHAQGDYMMAIREQEDCAPSLEELEADARELEDEQQLTTQEAPEAEGAGESPRREESEGEGCEEINVPF